MLLSLLISCDGFLEGLGYIPPGDTITIDVLPVPMDLLSFVIECTSYEATDSLTGGALVADRHVTVAGQTLAPGSDLSGLPIYVAASDTGAWPNGFPMELHAGESTSLAFDDTLIEFAPGTTTLTFSWTDGEGAVYADTLLVANGALQSW